MTFKSSYLSLDELHEAAEAQDLDVDRSFRGIYNQDGDVVASFSLSVLGEVTNIKAI